MKRSGKANSFQRDYLEENMRGTDFKGSKVTEVSNKYIYTEDGNKHQTKMQNVSFEEKPFTSSMIRESIDHDTEGGRL